MSHSPKQEELLYNALNYSYRRNEHAMTSLPGHVFMLCGLQGAGKSQVAKMLNKMIVSRRFNTDEIRYEITKRQYTAEESSLVYNAMLDRAYQTLHDGMAVVLDATYSVGDKRDNAIKSFKEAGYQVHLLYVAASEEVSLGRLKRRQELAEDVSEAGPEVYLAFKDKFEVPQDAWVIDNNADDPDQLHKQLTELVLTCWDAARPPAWRES